MTPLPCASRTGITCLQPRKTVLRLKSICRSHDSSVIVTGLPGSEPPTLLIKISTRLKRSIQASTIFLTAAESNISQRCVAQTKPSSSMVCRVCSTASFTTSTKKTEAPCRAKRTAVALPFPQPGPTEPAPVTIATFPVKFSMSSPMNIFLALSLPGTVDRTTIRYLFKKMKQSNESTLAAPGTN